MSHGDRIDYKKKYEQVKTVGDWLQLLKDPAFNWTECMLALSNYKPGDYTFEKIGEVGGDWSFSTDHLSWR